MWVSPWDQGSRIDKVHTRKMSPTGNVEKKKNQNLLPESLSFSIAGAKSTRGSLCYPWSCLAILTSILEAEESY